MSTTAASTPQQHNSTLDELEEEISLISLHKRTRMENWQIKLLDLTLRNNLLNSRIDRSQLELRLPDISGFEDALSNGKTFRIAPLPDNFRETVQQNVPDLNTEEVYAEADKLAAACYKRGELLSLDFRKFLGVDDNQKRLLPSGEELEKRVRKLYLTAHRNMQECGANTLYIACGFLKWIRRDKEQQTLYAPLLLIPVTLTRQKVKTGFTLRTSDEESRINLTLLELLKTEYGLRIPELEGELPSDKNGLDVTGIFNIVRQAISVYPGWEVTNTCALGIFSFAKYLMWKDMCDRSDELQRNDIVRHLADTNREKFPAQADFMPPEQLDEAADASQIYTPLSADSSQLSAILATGGGKNFVLIGPPGTGKSQTISNMIAHCLGHGKTVLFVAEKAAALNVVYNRLKRIGLGDFCLELHSNKAIKKEVLAQFKAALDKTEEKATTCKWKQEINQMLELRDKLNSLPAELHHRYPDDSTLYDDISDLCTSPAVPQLPAPSAHMQSFSLADKEALLNFVHELSIHFAEVENLYPGIAEDIASTQYSSHWEAKLAQALPAFAAAADAQDAALNAVMHALNLSPKEYADKRAALLRLLKLAARTVGQDNTPLLPASANKTLAALTAVLQQAETYRISKASLSLPYPDDLEDAPEIPILYNEWKTSQFSNFISRFFTTRRIRKALQFHAFCRLKPDIRRDLEALLTMKAAKQAISLDANKLPQYSKGLATLPRDLQTAEEVASILASIPELTALSTRYLTIAGNPMQPETDAASAYATLQQAAKEYQKRSLEVEALLAIGLPATAKNQEGAGKQWADKLMQLKKSWRSIVLWNACAAKAQNDISKACVRLLRNKEVPHAQLSKAVTTHISLSRLRETVDASKTLTQFSAGTHEAQISKFRTKDTSLLNTAKNKVLSQLLKRAQQVKDYGKEMAELQHELGKQRAHKAIRRLLILTPNVSRLLKPCMLMSPLSVAQYLTPESEPFDVVIFDEASQIPVWDAIGAIGRGKSAVIVGDPRQMPPTSFFSRGKTEESEEDEEIEVDLESILDECLACGIPQMNLSWHYRSKSESLIAYSNRNYYENKLVTFPAPVAKDTALQYHYIGGTYERGSSKRYNKKEAQALVDAVLSVLRSPGFEYNEMTSIGVVTFNTQQQALIQELFEKARAEDETLEPFFDEENPEAIFVKNLENVQGDERGVIYFSTTFGPDEKGNISMNFGPLNQTGGERRLNVAITRARTGMRVFSSLRPEDIDLNRTRARGVADLRGFLECARMGANAYFNTVGATGSDAESGLQHAVCAALEAKGWNCVSNLGVSGYRIDIAIADKRHPGNMLAGLVLDGPTYASAATARDRDILRESVLQSLGWNLQHVWALDWWRDPQGYADKLDEQLQAWQQ